MATLWPRLRLTTGQPTTRASVAPSIVLFDLPLQISRVSFLALSWTMVHPIDGASPLAGLSQRDLATRRAEIIVILKGIDEGYMQPVITRHSFRYDEVAWGGQFTRVFRAENGRMRLDLHALGAFTPVQAPERLPS
jgi:inward rectifier potassium channel